MLFFFIKNLYIYKIKHVTESNIGFEFHKVCLFVDVDINLLEWRDNKFLTLSCNLICNL